MEHDRRTIRVTLYEAETCAREDSLLQTIGWLQGLLEKVPLEHRQSARAEFSSCSDWDDGSLARIEIWYERPETDAEYKARKDAISRALEENQRQNERMELALYQHLKSKYGLGGLCGDSQQPKDDV